MPSAVTGASARNGRSAAAAWAGVAARQRDAARLPGRPRHEVKRSGQLLVADPHQVAPARDEPRQVAGLVADRPEVHGGDGPGGEVEADRDPEVAAATAQRPEQVGVLHGVRADHPPVRGDQLRRRQAVDDQPVPADHPADPAAQRQPAHADLAGVARAQPQPVRAQGRGDRAPGGARADADPPAGPVQQLNAADPPRVDDHAVRARAQPGHAVAAGTHGHGQPGVGRVAQRRRHPGRVAGADHQVRGAVGEQGRRGLGVAVVPRDQDLRGGAQCVQG
jgi:hypothetical protein